jgi:hypothetical protein
MMTDKLLLVGEYKAEWSKVLNLEIEEQEIYMARGLRTHVERRHPNCLEYLNLISDVIRYPDFIGVNPREISNQSIELIKQYNSNSTFAVE